MRHAGIVELLQRFVSNRPLRQVRSRGDCELSLLLLVLIHPPSLSLLTASLCYPFSPKQIRIRRWVVYPSPASPRLPLPHPPHDGGKNNTPTTERNRGESGMRRHTVGVVRRRHRSPFDSTAVVGGVHRSGSIVGPIERLQFHTRDMRCKRRRQSHVEVRVRAIVVDRWTVVQRSGQLPLVGRVKCMTCDVILQ